VFKSADGGATWSSTGPPDAFLLSLAIDSLNATTIYVGSASGTAGPGKVFKTSDGGAGWTDVSNGLSTAPSTGAVLSLAVDPVTDGVVYAGTDAGLYKSVNAGASWTSLTPLAFIDLVIDPKTHSTLYGSTGNLVWKSSDSGASWAPISTGLPGGSGTLGVLGLDPHSPGILYVTFLANGSGGGLFKSTNDGANWTPTSLSGQVVALAIDPLVPARLYAGTLDQGVFNSTDGGATWSSMSNGLARPFVASLAISPSGACVHAATANGPVFDFATRADPCAPAIAPPPPTTLVAAVLPSSRSVQVGVAATAFVTIINTGANTAFSVGISLAATIPASLKYNQTSCATNAVTGGDGVPVDIAAGGQACYVISITPTDPFAPTEVTFDFAGTNTGPVPTLIAINTLLMSASLTQVPDIVALVATATNDGILHVPGPAVAGAFAVATSNVGIGDVITVSANTGSTALDLLLSICQTDPATGLCISAVGPSVSVQINAGATPTFAIFATPGAAIPLDAATNRIFVVFGDSGAVIRGRTSVAVTTQ